MKISGFTDEICDSFAGQLQAAQSMGLRYISLRSAGGINIGDIPLAEIEGELLPLLRQYDISVSSIGSPLGKIALGDEAALNHQLEMAARLRNAAKLLSCGYVRLFSFYPPLQSSFDGRDAEVQKSLGQLLEIFAGSGVTPLLENEKELYGDTPERCAELANAFADQGLGLIFDPANFVQIGVDPWQAYCDLKPFIRYVHIKDAVKGTGTNVLCGTGDGKIPEILAALKADGYDGFLTLEPHLVEFTALAQLEQNGGQYLNTGEKMTPKEAFSRQLDAVRQIWNQ